MIVADLDHFKQINDNFGHEAGDQVIAAFAHEPGRAWPRSAPCWARLGGEEFAVFLPGSPLEAGAGLRRRRAQAALPA